MKKYKYVVVTPRMDNGGCLVLHNLCRILYDMGEDVKIFYLGDPRYDNQNHFLFWLKWVIFQIKVSIKELVVLFFGDRVSRCYLHKPKGRYKRKFIPKVDDDTIVIYSETTFGNPLHAKNVVRWLLLFNYIYKQKNGNPVGYEKGDLFFAYRDVFNDPILNPDCNLLKTPYIDLNLYKKTNYGKRSGRCYIIRKGAYRLDLPKEFDGIIIDNLPEKKKIEAFNKCEYCISYDTQTSYSDIAAMCGCISVVVPEQGKSRNDYLASDEKGLGIAFGFLDEEIKYAIDTREEVIEYFKFLNSSSLESTKNFIVKCEEYFNKINLSR